MDILKYLLCTMHTIVVKVRYRELGALNWTCNKLQWHWPYNVHVSIKSAIKRLLQYLPTMQRNYKLVWLWSLSQKKHSLSKSLTIVSSLDLIPMVNRCKVQTTELCICPYSSVPEQGMLEASPVKGNRKSAWFWKTDKRGCDKRRQTDPE